MKCLAREQYNNFILKQGMKYSHECYVIHYRIDDEYDIIKCLSQYTHNFLLLYINNIQKITLKDYFFYYANKHNCQDIFNEIYDDHLHCISDRIDKTIKDGGYIVFIRSKNRDGYNESFNIRKFQLKYLVGNLKDLHHIGCDYENGWAIPKLGDYVVEPPYTYRIIDKGKVLPDNCVVISPLPGIGDYMMFFSILYEYFNQKKQEGKEIYIATYENRKAEIQLLNVIFPEIPCLYFDNENTFNYYMKFTDTTNLESLFFSLLHAIQKKEITKGCHITDMFLESLGLDATFNKHKYSNIFTSRILDKIEKEEKNYIDNIFCERNYIGVQFFTGVYDLVNEVWMADPSRNWKEEYIKRFIYLCNKNKLNILTYGKTPYDNWDCKVIDNLSTLGYIYTVSKLSMTVGIDSSSGHIASIYEIPNITIWGKQTPFNLDGSPCSFRSLARNISIYSRRGDINDITPEYLFDKMMAVLTKKIKLDEGIISYDDQKQIYAVG